MPLNTYTNLTAALITHSHYTDITAVVDDLFRLGEAKIYRRLRLRTMEATFSVTMSSGTVEVPTDFVELKYAYINGNPVMELERRPAEWIIRKYNNRTAQSKPRFVGRRGNFWIFGPFPDATYAMSGVYYRRLESLFSTSTSWFTTNAPDLLFAAGMREIYQYKEDFQKAAEWERKFELAATDIEKEERREQRGGSGPARAVPDMGYR